MKSQKTALFLLMGVVCATTSISAYWREKASSVAHKTGNVVSGAVDAASGAYKFAKGVYGKYSDFKKTETGKKFHSYAKKYGTKAAEKAFDISMSYFK